VVFPQADTESKQVFDSAIQESAYLKYVNDSGLGIYEAMNLGLSRATGKYCWFINCGDRVVQESLPGLIKDLFRNQPEWVVGGGVFDWRPPQHMNLSNLHNFLSFKVGAFVSHQTVIAKTSLISEFGGFDTRYRVAADTKLITRLAKKSSPHLYLENISIVEKPNFASKYNRLARRESILLAIENRDITSVIRLISREIINLKNRVKRELKS
jgi:glycosyltransferase involved in cell wall biosynthesis